MCIQAGMQHCQHRIAAPSPVPRSHSHSQSHSLSLPWLTSDLPPQVVAHSTQSAEVKFVHYAQSSQCMNMSDSSVSYATAVCVVPS